MLRIKQTTGGTTSTTPTNIIIFIQSAKAAAMVWRIEHNMVLPARLYVHNGALSDIGQP